MFCVILTKDRSNGWSRRSINFDNELQMHKENLFALENKPQHVSFKAINDSKLKIAVW